MVVLSPVSCVSPRICDGETNVNYVNAGSLQSARNGAAADSARAEVSQREIVTVPVIALLPGDSPRLEGEDKAHIARLAEAEGPLPPVLVERRSMRVIDGMHRLMAALLARK